jgi:ABC-2 type transport system ATP-binding protein
MRLVEIDARVEYAPGRTAFEGRFEAGEGVTVLIGPNGAGKTTLVHLVAGVLPLPIARVEGKVSVLGANPYRDHWVKKYIALARQNPDTFNDFYPVRKLLRLYAVLKGEDPDAVDEVMEKLGLSSFADPHVKAVNLSFGTKRKLEVAKLMLSRSARVLLLDELIGLDPPTVRLVLEFLRARAEEGACVVVVTHEPRHLQLLSGRVVVLRGGRVLRVVESWRELREYLDRNLYEVTIVAEGGDPTALERVEGVERVAVEAGPRYVVKARCRVAAINSLVEALMKTGAVIHRVEYDEISPLFEP